MVRYRFTFLVSYANLTRPVKVVLSAESLPSAESRLFRLMTVPTDYPIHEELVSIEELPPLDKPAENGVQ